MERKATCRALFSKLLYLAESEELLPGADASARRSLVADVFGATDDDAAQLRIVSLYEVRVAFGQRILGRAHPVSCASCRCTRCERVPGTALLDGPQ